VTVGETLSHARRERGLSVDDVAADTRIRATLIRAIESDDFGLCGGEVYARGHVRSIAKVVGVDSVPLIAEFDAERGVPRVDDVVAAVAAPPTDRAIVARSERRGPNWTMAMAATLVIVCAIAGVALLLNRPGGTHNTNAGRTNTASTNTSTGQTHSHQQPPAVHPPPAIEPVDRATMVVKTLHGETWLSVTTRSGKQLYYGLLANGQQKSFTNRHALTFVIGNAPAVDVVVNGHDIGSPHATNFVAHGTVAPGASTVQQA
jgi:cytoskeletal protein RodZ